MVKLHIEDATKALNTMRSLRDYIPPFEIVGNYRLIDDGERPEATIILRANGREMHETSTGVGPVDALAKVLKKSLTPLFPELERARLVDFRRCMRKRSSGSLKGMGMIIVSPPG